LGDPVYEDGVRPRELPRAVVTRADLRETTHRLSATLLLLGGNPVTECLRRRARARGVRERVDTADSGGLDQVERVLERGAILVRETHDHVRRHVDCGYCGA